jgi:hypothetical protein
MPLCSYTAQAHKEHIRAHERQLAARSLYGKLYASLDAHGGTAACVYNMASAMNKLDNVSIFTYNTLHYKTVISSIGTDIFCI